MKLFIIPLSLIASINFSDNSKFMEGPLLETCSEGVKFSMKEGSSLNPASLGSIGENVRLVNEWQLTPLNSDCNLSLEQISFEGDRVALNSKAAAQQIDTDGGSRTYLFTFGSVGKKAALYDRAAGAFGNSHVIDKKGHITSIGSADFELVRQGHTWLLTARSEGSILRLVEFVQGPSAISVTYPHHGSHYSFAAIFNDDQNGRSYVLQFAWFKG